MNTVRWAASLAAAVLLTTSVARSEGLDASGAGGEPVEPWSIEETLPTEPGRWTLRFASDLSVRGRGDPVDRRFQQRAQAFIGLTDGLSAELHLPFVSRRIADDSRAGIGAFGAGLKARLFGDRSPVVLRGEFQLPAGDEMLGEASTEVEFGLASVVESGPWTLQGGPGYAALTDASERAVFAEASLALEAREGWHLLLEGAAARELESWRTEVLLGSGVRHSFADGWSVAIGGQASLVREDRNWRLSGQVQREF